jgi:hypothetical protein
MHESAESQQVRFVSLADLICIMAKWQVNSSKRHIPHLLQRFLRDDAEVFCCQ